MDADADGGRLSLTVADTGQGIDHDLLDRIFTPFFTTKKPGEGTGMGLSVVHGIVTAHGGTIDVESVPGRGTVCTITLPACRDAEIEAAAAAKRRTEHGS